MSGRVLPDFGERSAARLVQSPLQFFIRDFGPCHLIHEANELLVRQDMPERISGFVTHLHGLIDLPQRRPQLLIRDMSRHKGT